MKETEPAPPVPTLPSDFLYRVRGQVVILDADVAAFFGRTTKAVNQNRARNNARFPPDYAFRLTQEEWEAYRSQIVTTSSQKNRSTPPWAYTEHGFVMLAMGFRGEEADRIARVVADTFVAYRRGELAREPVLIGAEAQARRNSLRARIYDMMEAISAMPLPGGNTALEELESTTEKALGRVRAWLDQPKLENAKLDAEIAHLAAATQKAYAEVAKLDAEAANIWADTVLKRLSAVRQLRDMAAQIERDEVAGLLKDSFGAVPTLAVTDRDHELTGPDE